MEIFFSLILTLALILGQLIKLPITAQSSLSMLDAAVIILSLLGIAKLKIKLLSLPLFLKGGVLFILTAGLSLVLSPLPLIFSEYAISFLYTLRFSFYVLLAWEIYLGVFPLLNKKIPLFLLFSGFSIALLGLLQFIFLPDLSFLQAKGWDPHYFRTVSTFLDPNFSGAFFVLTLLLLAQKSHLGGGIILTRRVLYFAFAIIYFALLTTFSRSSYAMFLISFSVWAFLIRSWRLFVVTLLLSLILLSGFIIYTKTVSEPRNIDRIQSASFRFNSWQQGLTLFWSHPLLGVGFNAYKFALKNYNLGDEQFLQSHGSTSNDASLLFVASTTGIVGLFVYLYFLLVLTAQRNIVSAAILGLIIHSFFANSLFYPPILLWILLTSIPRK